MKMSPLNPCRYKRLFILLFASVSVLSAPTSFAYPFDAKSWPANLGTLTITCKIDNHGQADCEGSQGNISENYVWSGASPALTTGNSSVINKGKELGFLTAAWPNNNRVTTVQHGISLYYGTKPSGIFSKYFTASFTVISHDVPPENLTFTDAKGHTLSAVFNPEGSALYAQTKSETNGCSWGGNLKPKVSANLSLIPPANDSFLFLTNHSSSITGTFATKFTDGYYTTPCHPIIYTDGLFFTLKPITDLKDLPAGTYQVSSPITYNDSTQVTNFIFSRESPTKQTAPSYPVIINKVIVKITQNDYLDSPEVKLTNGNTSVSKIISYDRVSGKFDSPTMDINIRPPQNSTGIDTDYGLSWSAPTFTDKDSNQYTIQADFYPSPNGQGTPLRLTKNSGLAIGSRLQGCDLSNLTSTLYCPQAYGIKFSIPTNNVTPASGEYHASGILTIWGDLHPTG